MEAVGLDNSHIIIIYDLNGKEFFYKGVILQSLKIDFC